MLNTLHALSFYHDAKTGGYMRTGTGTGVETHPEVPRFFVTGACGQIGQEIIPFLRDKWVTGADD